MEWDAGTYVSETVALGRAMLAEDDADSGGKDSTAEFARGLALFFQWSDILTAMGALAWYIFCWQKGRCKWEVIYVCICSALVDIGKLWKGQSAPITIVVEQTGEECTWLRYAGWLLTCPVILIHMSNLAGERVFNVTRMMHMVIGVQLMLLSAITASMSQGAVKWIFYLMGIAFCTQFVFRQAFSIFSEAISTFPPRAGQHCKYMASVFFSSWSGYALVWFLSDTGVNWMSRDSSALVYAILDIISKTVWGLLGWYLRWEILKIDQHKNNPYEKGKDKPVQVLIYEQDDIFAGFFQSKLQQLRAEVDIASSQDEVLAMLDNTGYDFLLANYNLLRHENYEIMFELRRAAFILPVIAYGRTKPEEGTMEKLYMRGIDGFLQPPFPEEELRTIMTQWRRQHHQQTVDVSRSSLQLERKSGDGFVMKDGMGKAVEMPRHSLSGRPRRFSLSDNDNDTGGDMFSRLDTPVAPPGPGRKPGSGSQDAPPQDGAPDPSQLSALMSQIQSMQTNLQQLQAGGGGGGGGNAPPATANPASSDLYGSAPASGSVADLQRELEREREEKKAWMAKSMVAIAEAEALQDQNKGRKR